jgi:hypothetical protein
MHTILISVVGVGEVDSVVMVVVVETDLLDEGGVSRDGDEGVDG